MSSDTKWIIGTLVVVGGLLITQMAMFNSRIGDVNTRISDLTQTVNSRIGDLNRRFDDLNATVDGRFDDLNSRVDDVQTDVRELRRMLLESVKVGEPAE